MSVFQADILQRHVALITGGGTGICRGIAAAYLRHGARVALLGRRADVLQSAADELAASTGGQVLAVPADVRQPDSVADAVARTLERFGRLDTLINGAAGNFLAPAVGLSANGLRTVLEIDLIGTFTACKAVFDALQAAGDALILNISATLHYHGTPLQLHASAAKAGVDALTRTLAVEWGPLGIRVNAIAPGPIGDTEGMRRLAPGDVGERMRAQIPLRRFGEIQEIADAAVFLRSSAAAYIHGAVLVVDGGQAIAQPSVF